MEDKKGKANFIINFQRLDFWDSNMDCLRNPEKRFTHNNYQQHLPVFKFNNGLLYYLL